MAAAGTMGPVAGVFQSHPSLEKNALTPTLFPDSLQNYNVPFPASPTFPNQNTSGLPLPCPLPLPESESPSLFS